MTRLLMNISLTEEQQLKLTIALTALAVLAISIYSCTTALGYELQGWAYCSDRPWLCLIHDHVDVARGVPHRRAGLPARRLPRAQSSHHVDVNDLIAPLADKVREIVHVCHSQLISAFRPHAVVAGTHRASLHSLYPARAADIHGNPTCIYTMLHGWPGGVSVDYSRVRHVHLSYDPNGREWHARFNHGGHHRYAHKHKHMNTRLSHG